MSEKSAELRLYISADFLGFWFFVCLFVFFTMVLCHVRNIEGIIWKMERMLDMMKRALIATSA